MFRLFRQIVGTLSHRNRRGLGIAAGLAALNSLLELVSAGLIVVLIQLVAAPAQILSNHFIASFRDFVGDPSRDTFTAILAVIITVFVLFKNVSQVLQTALLARVANRTAAEMAIELLQRFLAMPYERFRDVPTSELVRSVTASADAGIRTFFFGISTILTEILVIATLVTTLLVVDPLIAVASGVLLASIGALAQRRLRRSVEYYAHRSHESYERAFFHLQQAFGAAREVRLYGRERYFRDAYAGVRSRWYEVLWRYDTAVQIPRFVFETIFVGALSLVILVVALRGTSGNGATPILGLYAYAAFRMLPSVNRIVGSLSVARFHVPAVGEILDYVKEPLPPLRELPEARPTSSDFHTIELEDVVYRYPGRTENALDGISLAIRHGERVGIVGPSGAGKSTLLDVLIGLVPATAGALRLDGVDLTRRLEEWQSQIGYVPQAPYVIADTLRRNVAFGVEEDRIDHGRVAEAVRLARLDEVVAEMPLGLDTAVGELGSRLSGGQRQRLAIARALYRDPALMVFDEATSSLDYESEREVTAALESLAGRKAMIIVAHRLAAVRSCDRIVLLERGRVGGEGTFDELVRSNETFARMVATGALPVEGELDGAAVPRQETQER
jgi:ATP-binding cassette, subfamily B, bacterial PglK